MTHFSKKSIILQVLYSTKPTHISVVFALRWSPGNEMGVVVAETSGLSLSVIFLQRMNLIVVSIVLKRAILLKKILVL